MKRAKIVAIACDGSSHVWRPLVGIAFDCALTVLNKFDPRPRSIVLTCQGQRWTYNAEVTP